MLLNDPVPLDDHVAELAPPPNEPFIVAVDPEQIVCAEPALTVAAGLIVNVIEALTLPHGPLGSSVV